MTNEKSAVYLPAVLFNMYLVLLFSPHRASTHIPKRIAKGKLSIVVHHRRCSVWRPDYLQFAESNHFLVSAEGLILFVEDSPQFLKTSQGTCLSLDMTLSFFESANGCIKESMRHLKAPVRNLSHCSIYSFYSEKQ
ncbi:hypothetical protein G9A89_002647 [Geosiphon pyriformis]|nr:hypothetical protein G9A89_002647 [Geosiphon pyriformis]